MTGGVVQKYIFFLFFIFSFQLLNASDHGIYLHAVADISADVESVAANLDKALVKNGYNVLANRIMATPDMVREDKEDLCGFKAQTVVFTSPEYVNLLTSFGNKYLVAAFLRAGIYQTPTGTQLTFANPETINRIVFNDLSEDKYKEIVEASAKVKNDLLEISHNLNLGNNINIEIMIFSFVMMRICLKLLVICL